MLNNHEGKPVPNVTFRVRENNEWKNVTTDDLFKNKTVCLIYNTTITIFLILFGCGGTE